MHRPYGGPGRGGASRRLALLAGADREINRLVYELYDLTEEEITIVEGKDL